MELASGDSEGGGDVVSHVEGESDSTFKSGGKHERRAILLHSSVFKFGAVICGSIRQTIGVVNGAVLGTLHTKRSVSRKRCGDSVIHRIRITSGEVTQLVIAIIECEGVGIAAFLSTTGDYQVSRNAVGIKGEFECDDTVKFIIFKREIRAITAIFFNQCECFA